MVSLSVGKAAESWMSFQIKWKGFSSIRMKKNDLISSFSFSIILIGIGSTCTMGDNLDNIYDTHSNKKAT